MVFHAAHVSFRVGHSGKSGKPQCTFVVSRKTTKRAVDRNLLKRRGRAIVREALSRAIPQCGGTFFFKKGAEVLLYTDLKKEVVTLLKKSEAV